MDNELENYRSYKTCEKQEKPFSLNRLWSWTWLAIKLIVPVIFRVTMFFVWVAAHVLWIIAAMFGGLIVGALEANSPSNFRRRQREKGDYRWG